MTPPQQRELSERVHRGLRTPAHSLGTESQVGGRGEDPRGALVTAGSEAAVQGRAESRTGGQTPGNTAGSSVFENASGKQHLPFSLRGYRETAQRMAIFVARKQVKVKVGHLFRQMCS